MSHEMWPCDRMYYGVVPTKWCIMARVMLWQGGMKVYEKRLSKGKNKWNVPDGTVDKTSTSGA